DVGPGFLQFREKLIPFVDEIRHQSRDADVRGRQDGRERYWSDVRNPAPATVLALFRLRQGRSNNRVVRTDILQSLTRDGVDLARACGPYPDVGRIGSRQPCLLLVTPPL